MAAEPPNNPLKLPLLVVCALIALAVAIVGAVAGNPVLLLIGGAVQLFCWVAIREVVRGRNPRWLRSPLDR